MTRTLTLLVLGCLLLTGVAVASIIGRDALPSFSSGQLAQNSIEVARGPISNQQGKKDKLVIDTSQLASLAPDAVDPAERLRQAYAPDAAVGGAPATTLPPVVVPSPAARPKAAAKPVQKTYTLLSDAQIAAIRGRLNLTAAQESYWPGVETALRAVARKLHDTRQGGGAPPALDPDSAEVQQLKSAAMPLLFQLREDQKREVRALARMIGLEKVASAI